MEILILDIRFALASFVLWSENTVTKHSNKSNEQVPENISKKSRAWSFRSLRNNLKLPVSQIFLYKVIKIVKSTFDKPVEQAIRLGFGENELFLHKNLTH